MRRAKGPLNAGGVRAVSPTELWQAVAVRLERAGIESAALEAQILVGLALGLSRVETLTGRDLHPSPQQLEELERLAGAREQRIPLAYLRGTQEFFGLTFEVSPAVLIPRPETELLVELAVERLGDRRGGTLVDVGTGSGCVPVAVAHSLPSVQCIGVDISADALEIAGRNAARNGVEDRVQLVRGDMLEPIRRRIADVVVSNPPYIPSGEIPQLQAEVRDYEPRLALDGGEDGFVFHRRLLTGSKRVLKPGGMLAIEVAMGQAVDVAKLMSGSGFSRVMAHRDLAGIERVVAARVAED